jgi:hypothetical protein
VDVFTVIEYCRDRIALTKSSGTPEMSQPVGALLQLREVDRGTGPSKDQSRLTGPDVIAYLHDVTLESVDAKGSNLHIL